MEGKFKTKKIMLLSGVLLAVMIFLKKSSQLITLPTKALLVKLPLNAHTPSVHPSQKMQAYMCRLALNIAQVGSAWTRW